MLLKPVIDAHGFDLLHVSRTWSEGEAVQHMDGALLLVHLHGGSIRIRLLVFFLLVGSDSGEGGNYD